MSQFFVRELETHGTLILVDELQVSEFVKKYVIEHESSDG
jgi:hypothetical protein